MGGIALLAFLVLAIWILCVLLNIMTCLEKILEAINELRPRS